MKFKLKIITPVVIGNGEVYNKNVDFIQDGDYIKIIDHSKFSDIIPDRLFKEYLVMLKQASDKKGGVNLTNFIKKYNIKNIDKAVKYKVKLSFSSPEFSKRDIDRIITSSDKVYIPGSSVKGSIRTALIYNYIKKPVNLSSLDRYIRKNNYIGQYIFSSFGNDIMKYFVVSDTDLKDKLSTVNIFQTKILNLENGKLEVPTRSFVNNTEGILPKKEFNLDIYFKEKLIDLALKKDNDTKGYLNRLDVFVNKDYKKLIAIIDNFYKALLDREIEFVSRYAQLSSYKGILEKIKNKTDGKNSALIRLGKNKTMVDNTIFLVLQKDKDYFNVLKRHFRNRFTVRKLDDFPISRKFVDAGKYGYVPYGWAMLEM